MEVETFARFIGYSVDVTKFAKQLNWKTKVKSVIRQARKIHTEGELCTC